MCFVQDELHTRQEMRGIRATVYKFYQHLKCRKGWVMDLINALHQNNAGHLAEELQQVYDLYQARKWPQHPWVPPACLDACFFQGLAPVLGGESVYNNCVSCRSPWVSVTCTQRCVAPVTCPGMAECLQGSLSKAAWADSGLCVLFSLS